MYRNSTKQFKPRNGHTLRVINLSRISTEHQDEKSLADQERQNRIFIETCFPGKIEFETISTRGSGEYLDREEIIKLKEMINSSTYDILIAEDLGRICRRNYAFSICEQCEDNGIRLITLNDGLDTSEENWRDSAFFATWHHEKSNKDTSMRIKRTLRGRFERGEAITNLIAGYEKPIGAKHDSEIRKKPEFERIYDEWFTRLEKGQSFAEVADWLNQEQVPLGPYSREARWTGTTVGRVTRNTLLKGVRQRNKKITKRNNKTGRPRCIPAPKDMLMEKRCTHLQFIEPERFDRVIEMLNLRNARYRRKGVNGVDTRAHVPKKKTIFPGQSVKCGVCGHLYVYGGHGRKDFLMCEGAKNYQCWNSLTFDGNAAREKFAQALLEKIELVPEFDKELRAKVEQELHSLTEEKSKFVPAKKIELEQVGRELNNLITLAKSGVKSEELSAEINKLSDQSIRLKEQIKLLQLAPVKELELPSMSVIKGLALEALQKQEYKTQEYLRLMQKLLPEIYVFPHRLCDGDKLVLKARLKLSLAEFMNHNFTQIQQIVEHLSREMIVDLFTLSQPLAFREKIMKLKNQRLTEKAIASQFGLTVTVVQRAAALQRSMDQLEITDPWQPLFAAPNDIIKFKRHLNIRYLFSPEEGFPKKWPC